MLSALKSFAVTFIISAVIFGIAAYFMCGYMLETFTPVLDPVVAIDKTKTPSDSNGSGTKETDDPADKEEIKGTSFNILLVGTDYTPEKFEHYVIDNSDNYIKNIYAEYLEYLEELAAEAEAETETEAETEDEGADDPLDPETRPESEKEDDDTNEEPEEIIDPNINILKKDYPRVTTDLIILIRFDKENEQITFTQIPSNTRLHINSAFTTIGTLYTKYGIDFLVDKVTAITGVGIDYYSVINITEIPKLLGIVESVEVEVAQDIYFYDNEYLTKNEAFIIQMAKAGNSGESIEEINVAEHVFSPGIQEITPENVTALLSFDKYADKIAGEMNAYLNFYKAFFKKALNKDKLEEILLNRETPPITEPETTSESEGDEPEKIPATYEETLKHVLTNLSLETYYEQIELILSYSDFDIIDISYPGSFKTLDGIKYFVPDTTEGINRFKKYRGESNLRKLYDPVAEYSSFPPDVGPEDPGTSDNSNTAGNSNKNSIPSVFN